MLNYQLVTPEIQAYLQEHLWEEAPKFALKKSPFSGVSASELSQQLLGRQKAKDKLPLWHRTQGIDLLSCQALLGAGLVRGYRTLQSLFGHRSSIRRYGGLWGG